MVRAAVYRRPGDPLEVTDVELNPPGPGELRVELTATGVCHSDLSLARGVLRQPAPAVLGHESAGVVAEVGEGVGRFAVGDRVVLCWAPPCRECWHCTQGEPWLCERSADRSGVPYGTVGGEPLYQGLATGGFARETVVPAAAAIPVPDGIELEQAALLGCAVLTGWGAVVNTAGVRQGQSGMVVGLGGVGLSVVQSLRLAGADVIVAVDSSPEKLEVALSMGATHAMEAGPDVAKAVRKLTGGRGADHGFDCVGKPVTLRSCWSASRRGGSVTVVGVGSKDDTAEFSMLELFHFARTLRGCVYGSMDPHRDIPILLGHVAAGRLDVSALISARIGLDDVNEAFAEMEAGRGARSMVVF